MIMSYPVHALQCANPNSSQRSCRLESKRTISLIKPAFISWKIATACHGCSGNAKRIHDPEEGSNARYARRGSILQEGRGVGRNLLRGFPVDSACCA